MKQMRYRGFGRREVSAADFAAQGVKSKDVAANQGEVVEMNDAAAAWFNEYEAADWQEISEREAARLAKEAEDQAKREEAVAAAQAEVQAPPADEEA
jgi:hypothetical protein